MALDGAGEDHRRPAVSLGRLRERVVQRREIVPVDLEHARAKRARAACVGAQIPAQFRRPALTEPVDVDDRDEIRQLIVARLVQRLPHRAFRHLAVAAQHPHSKRHPIEVFPGQRDPHPVGQPLTERSGRDVDPRQHRSRVALQTGPEAPVTAHQLLVRHDPDGLVDGVEQRRGVPLGEDQVIVPSRLGLVPVIAQVASDEDRQEIGRRHARRRMTRASAGAGTDRIHAQLSG